MYSYISVESVILKPELFTSTLQESMLYIEFYYLKKFQIKWFKHTLKVNIKIFIFCNYPVGAFLNVS